MSTLTVELLVSAMTSPRFEGPDIDPIDAERYLEPLVAACKKYGITTRARLAAFLGQTGHESGSFRWWREFGWGEGKPYGFYYGRGPIQLTWEDAYRAFEAATGYEAYQNPEIVADDPKVGFESAGWFWRDLKGLNALADHGTWEAYREITGRVWGSAEYVPERDNRYAVAWEALPEDLDLTKDEYPATELTIDDKAWVRLPDGSYAKLPEPNLKACSEAGRWVYVPSKIPEAEPEPEGYYAEPWPYAWERPGYIGDGSYIDLYPTRYTWREDIDELARKIIGRFGVWCNTYVDHPPGWALDQVSVDVWAYAGRSYELDPDLGQEVFDYVFNDPNPPWIRWTIWQGWIWDDYNGWRWYWDQDPWSDGGHYKHIHFTFW